MNDLLNIIDVYEINFSNLLLTGFKFGALIGFTVVFISLGIKYSLKLFAKS